jgi:cold-inducible RNA-binding protein
LGLNSRPRFIDSEGQKKKMGTKLYVGNLSFRTTSEELREAFAAAGTVESATVIEDRDSGRSRGFAFVEMATAEEAAAAIEQFNGKEFGGRNLTVNEAKPRTDRWWSWWLRWRRRSRRSWWLRTRATLVSWVKGEPGKRGRKLFSS